jgi:hypothetical protein
MKDIHKRIATLRDRAADPSSTENERRIAATVADRLQLRLDAQRTADPVWDSGGRVRVAVGPPPAAPSLDGGRVDAPWPPGYDGPRRPVEFQATMNGSEVCLGWDCPACGGWVSKAIGLWHIYRLVGAKVDPLKVIRGMMDGRHNQLCSSCTARYAATGG